MTDRKRKPPVMPMPESPDPMVIYAERAGVRIPIAIPLSDKFRAAQSGTGFASLLTHGCTVRTLV